MGLKASLSKSFAKYIKSKIEKWSNDPVGTQEKVFNQLIQKASNTKFGRDHKFSEIKSHADFVANVPVRDYEGLKHYVEEIKEGKPDILWPGLPIYFCKTSGTTSGVKYIPLTKDSMPNHIRSARNAILCYIADTGQADFVNGKMMFLQGSPELEVVNKIPFGRLSGIVAHHVPSYLQKNRMPTYEVNCIEDWEEKVDAIVDQTIPENMTLISGIPAWVQMYFEKIAEKTGKKIKDVFPNFSLFIYGGVNFEPYRNRFEELVGKQIPSIELYPASEGFIAYQDSQSEEGMLMVLDDGIFYEFIKAEDYFNENPRRYSIGEVELGVNYALILNTNAGLWGYSIGDTVKFTSLKPARVIVSGRIKHFTSAFGEHVIAEEVEHAIQEGMSKYPCEIVEFTVAPEVNPREGELPYHEWFVEFYKEPDNLEGFCEVIDQAMQKKNPYYLDLLEGNILQRLKITKIRAGGFTAFMKDRGKLGGQNKIPRLSNDRKIANELKPYTDE